MRRATIAGLVAVLALGACGDDEPGQPGGSGGTGGVGGTGAVGGSGGAGGTGGVGGSGGTGGVGGGTPVRGCEAPTPCLEIEEWMALPELGLASELVVQGDTAYVAGYGGVVRVDLGSGAKELLPLPGVERNTVNAIAVSASAPEVVVAGVAGNETGAGPLFVSEDGGDTWRSVDYPKANAVPVQRRSLLFAPGSEADGAGLLFVNTGCGSLALSDDRGATFRTLHTGGDLCVETPIGLSGDGKTLWLGAEFSFDTVQILRRDITARAATPAGDWEIVVSGPDLLSNHDPNVIVADPHDPEAVYIGAELSLMHVSGDDEFRYVLGSADESREVPYYVTAVWIDRDDPLHFVVGGGENGGRTHLVESFDGGATALELELPGEAGPTGRIEGFAPIPGTDEFLVLRTEYPSLDRDDAEARTTLLKARRARD